MIITNIYICYRQSKEHAWPARTFYNEVEELWPWVTLTLNRACVKAIISYIHFLYLKAVLMFVSNTGHYGHTWIHRPLVIPCEYDAWAVQPGSFRDPIQQVAPGSTKKDTFRFTWKNTSVSSSLLKNVFDLLAMSRKCHLSWQILLSSYLEDTSCCLLFF